MDRDDIKEDAHPWSLFERVERERGREWSSMVGSRVPCRALYGDESEDKDAATLAVI